MARRRKACRLMAALLPFAFTLLGLATVASLADSLIRARNAWRALHKD